MSAALTEIKWDKHMNIIHLLFIQTDMITHTHTHI